MDPDESFMSNLKLFHYTYSNEAEERMKMKRFNKIEILNNAIRSKALNQINM